jgi:hypothetical protein
MTETLSLDQLRRELEQKVPESVVVAAGLRTFALRGWKVWRNNVGGVGGERKGRDGRMHHYYVAFGDEGLPDITGYTPWGAHVAAEAKRPSGTHRLTPPQFDHLAAVRKAGGVAIVFSSAQELQDAITLAECEHQEPGAYPGSPLRTSVAAAEARFALRPGDRERWALSKFKRRTERREKRLAARRSPAG